MVRDYYDTTLNPRTLATIGAYLGGQFGVNVTPAQQWGSNPTTKELTYPAQSVGNMEKNEAIALLLHEIGHVADSTAYDVPEGTKFRDRFGERLSRTIVNALEDWRVDARVLRRYEHADEITPIVIRQACAQAKRDLYDVAGIDGVLEAKRVAMEAWEEYKKEGQQPVSWFDSLTAGQMRAIMRKSFTTMAEAFDALPDANTCPTTSTVYAIVVDALCAGVPDAERAGWREYVESTIEGHVYPVRIIDDKRYGHDVGLLPAQLAQYAREMDGLSDMVYAMQRYATKIKKPSARYEYMRCASEYTKRAVERVMLQAYIMGYGEDVAKPVDPKTYRGSTSYYKTAGSVKTKRSGWWNNYDDGAGYGSWYAEQDERAQERYRESLDLWERAQRIADTFDDVDACARTQDIYDTVVNGAVYDTLCDLTLKEVNGNEMDKAQGTYTPSDGEQRKPETMNDKRGFDKRGEEALEAYFSWDKTRDRIRKEHQATLTKMRRQVQENASRKFGGRFRSGAKLNAGKLWKAGIKGGDTRLFQRQVDRRNYDFALSVLVDVSGSMSSNKRMRNAYDSLVLIAESARAMGGHVEINAFHYGVARAVRFGEKIRGGHVDKVFAAEYGGGTNLAEAMNTTRRALDTVRAERKALFVITDADIHADEAKAVQARDATMYVIGGNAGRYSMCAIQHDVRDVGQLAGLVAQDIKRMINGK